MTPEKAARGGPVEACHPKEVSTGTDFKVCPCGKHYIQGTVKEKQCPACNARELAELAEDIPAVMFHCPNCGLEFQDESDDPDLAGGDGDLPPVRLRGAGMTPQDRQKAFQDEIRRRASCPYSDPVKQRMDGRLGRGERLQGMT
jgi:hypothetical protein